MNKCDKRFGGACDGHSVSAGNGVKIYGSEAAAVAGLDRYSSAYTVWAEKTGRLARTDGEAVRQGRELERYILRRWKEETGGKCGRVWIQCPGGDWDGGNRSGGGSKYPFARIEYARRAGTDKSGRVKTGLECVAARELNLRRLKNGVYPADLYVRCVHNMAATGAVRWHLAVLVPGREFAAFAVGRDEDEVKALMEAESEFGECVARDTPPPPDGLPSAKRLLETMFGADAGDGEGGNVTDTNVKDTNVTDAGFRLSGRDGLVRRWREVSGLIAGLEAERDGIRELFTSEMGGRETGWCGGAKIIWRTVRKPLLDAKLLKRDYPGIDLTPYFRDVSYRIFRITNGGGSDGGNDGANGTSDSAGDGASGGGV